MAVHQPTIRSLFNVMLSLLFVFFISPETTKLANAQLANYFRVGGYLPDYRADGINLNDTAPFLTDLILFSVLPKLEGQKVSFDCCVQEKHFEAAREAKAYRQQIEPDGAPLTIWLTVGGGGRSDDFVASLNNGLAEAIIEVALKEKVDGIDLDCESFRSAQDYTKYMTWLRKSTELFHNKGFLVGVALHAGQHLPHDLYKFVDRVHLMAYDLLGGAYHAHDHAVIDAVHTLKSSGCPTDRIMLGIPAYARGIEEPYEAKTFAELIDGKRGEDGNDKVYEENLDAFHEFDKHRGESPYSVREKVKFAADGKLAGIFFWELGQDKRDEAVAKGGILLEAAAGKVFSMAPVEERDEL